MPALANLESQRLHPAQHRSASRRTSQQSATPTLQGTPSRAYLGGHAPPAMPPADRKCFEAARRLFDAVHGCMSQTLAVAAAADDLLRLRRQAVDAQPPKAEDDDSPTLPATNAAFALTPQLLQCIVNEGKEQLQLSWGRLQQISHAWARGLPPSDDNHVTGVEFLDLSLAAAFQVLREATGDIGAKACGSALCYVPAVAVATQEPVVVHVPERHAVPARLRRDSLVSNDDGDRAAGAFERPPPPPPREPFREPQRATSATRRGADVPTQRSRVVAPSEGRATDARADVDSKRRASVVACDERNVAATAKPGSAVVPPSEKRAVSPKRDAHVSSAAERQPSIRRLQSRVSAESAALDVPPNVALMRQRRASIQEKAKRLAEQESGARAAHDSPAEAHLPSDAPSRQTTPASDPVSRPTSPAALAMDKRAHHAPPTPRRFPVHRLPPYPDADPDPPTAAAATAPGHNDEPRGLLLGTHEFEREPFSHQPIG